MKRFAGILVFAAAVGGFTWAAVALAGEAAPKAIKVTLQDTKISLSAKSAPVGKVTFVVKNNGKLVHNFRVGGKTTKALAHGKTARLVVTFKVAKSYAYVSTLPHGKTKGLKGVFKARATTVPALIGNAKAGKTVFGTTCAACHTLTAAGAVGTIGPNLDKVANALTQAKIITAVTEGGASIMTKAAAAKYTTHMVAYKGVLSTKQIQDVAAFVYTSTHP